MVIAKHLGAHEIEEFGRQLDAIRDEVMDSRGERDRAYILYVIRLQRSPELAARAIIFFSVIALPIAGSPFANLSIFIAAVILGAALLATAKIIENMEIGHNVMHAQWDWMCDPAIQSNTWEWDNVCPSDQWKYSHNVVHHTWANVLRKDPDIGFGVLRVTDRINWTPKDLFNPLIHLFVMLLFQWGVAVYHVGIEIIIRNRTWAEMQPEIRQLQWKAWRQIRKDYLLWPLLGAVLALLLALGFGVDILIMVGFAILTAVAANMIANGLRNIWSSIVIFCGHFSEGVHHFEFEELEGESRGQWYIRQLLGSANIEGGRLIHFMTGNLSHQIEHHLFPDMPSNRYIEIAPRIKTLAARYGLTYNTGSLLRQFGTVLTAIWRLSLPAGPAAKI